MARFTADPTALYFTDNGRVVCGAHLGCCASMTGRDISGQRIAKVTAGDHAEAASMKWTIECEDCSAARRREEEEMTCDGCGNAAPVDGSSCSTCKMIAAVDAE